MPLFRYFLPFAVFAASAVPVFGVEEAAPVETADTQGEAVSQAARVAKVAAVIDALAATPGVDSGTVGFYLAPLRDAAEPLAERDGGRSFITASTMKTLTTGSALEILGPDFRFATELLFSRETGDIILRGAGDPSLGRPSWEPLFEEWERAVRAAGIREVRGRVIADETAWEPDELGDGWTWLDIGNYYAPVLTPLCFHDNSFQMYFRLTNSPGKPAEFYDADPWPPGLVVKDRVLTGRPGTGDNAYVFQAPGTGVLTVRGTFAADAGKDFLRAALPDPALFCAQRFAAWLNGRDIPVHGAATTTRREGDAVIPKSAQVIATVKSAPLGKMLVPINHRSLNLDCECLLRTVGRGSARDGLRAIRRHFAAKGLPLAGYEQEDGSGLARTNMVTPRLLARANAAFLTGPHGAVYRASLAKAGESASTLRVFQPAVGAEIRAKSGTIERVKSYTGVVRSAGGSEYIFAVLVNNYDGSYSELVGPRMAELFEALGEL